MTKRFITPREASEYLGLKVKTVYSLAARGRIPAVRFGRQLRIDLARLDELVESELSISQHGSAVPVNARRSPLRAPGPSSLHRGQNERGG